MKFNALLRGSTGPDMQVVDVLGNHAVQPAHSFQFGDGVMGGIGLSFLHRSYISVAICFFVFEYFQREFSERENCRIKNLRIVGMSRVSSGLRKSGIPDSVLIPHARKNDDIFRLSNPLTIISIRFFHKKILLPGVSGELKAANPRHDAKLSIKAPDILHDPCLFRSFFRSVTFSPP